MISITIYNHSSERSFTIMNALPGLRFMDVKFKRI